MLAKHNKHNISCRASGIPKARAKYFIVSSKSEQVESRISAPSFTRRAPFRSRMLSLRIGHEAEILVFLARGNG